MNKNQLQALGLIALAAFCAFLKFGAFAALIVAFGLAALLTPLRTMSLLRANTVASEFNLNTVLDTALQAYKRAILPITVFATVFRNIALKGTSAKVEVPYYPLVTKTSTDFDQDDCYVFDDSYAVATREITINKRKYQPISVTSAELARTGPALNMEKIFAMAGEKLAYDVIQDVMSVITAANYGAAAFTGADTTFDSDDIADLVGVADTIPWPTVGRGLVVKPTYKANLLKDNDVKLTYAYGDDGVIKDAVLPRVMGFDFGSTPAIPANGENLVGFISHMSAILFGQSPIEPAPAVRDMLTRYEIVTDESGISLEYRTWGDPNCDSERHIIEVNYGYGKGNEDGLRRLVSA